MEHAEITSAPGSVRTVHGATHATILSSESFTGFHQWVLHATVGDGHDDHKVVSNRSQGAFTTTTCLDVKFPVPLSEGRVREKRFLERAGVLADVLLPLHQAFAVGQRGANVAAFVVPEGGRKVARKLEGDLEVDPDFRGLVGDGEG